MDSVFALGLGYLLGSIPFGLLLTRAFGAGDLRQIGSGNIGATNVLRTGRKGLAAATVLLDAGKGALAIAIADWLWPGSGGFAAVGAIVGHCFPVWLRFKGGKGFATAAGVLLALAWPAFLVCAIIWAAMLAYSRTSSLSSLTTVIAAPLVAAIVGHAKIVPVMIVIALIVIFQHRANIARLRAGTEPRLGSKAERNAPTE